MSRRATGSLGKARKNQKGGVLINLLPSGRVEVREGLARAKIETESFRSPLSIIPFGLLFRLFRNVHHRAFWTQQLAVA